MKTGEIKDSELCRLAHSLVGLSMIVDYPVGKVGAIQRFPLKDREFLKELKSKHFNHPRP